MTEFEIYLPTQNNDGSPVKTETIDQIKSRLKEVFGGYTHFDHQNEGAWQMGNVTFRENVTLLRILDDGDKRLDMTVFKTELESLLKQEKILIVKRAVEVL